MERRLAEVPTAGVEALALFAEDGGFQRGLRAFGIDELRAALRIQLAPQDVVRFMFLAAADSG